MTKDNQDTEIKLDLSKLLGFQTLAEVSEDAGELARAMDDLHGKVGVPEGSDSNTRGD